MSKQIGQPEHEEGSPRPDRAVKREQAPPSKRAVIYLRVSTKEQTERDGDPEGYSIPAQRKACGRRAHSLEAVVVGEYVDRGESAKTADRPALRAMLERVAEGDIDMVIVHKVDRLARNRADDVQITMTLKTAHVQLVSVTENIDETPSGHLLHGTMASIAEFYSQNLANEIMKGTLQKVKGGGTPTLAAIGYLNVRKTSTARNSEQWSLTLSEVPSFNGRSRRTLPASGACPSWLSNSSDVASPREAPANGPSGRSRPTASTACSRTVIT
jgi:DNA invertase Pin-like site-specific DNA recombinase